jgi:hypothetical protein
MLAHRSMANSAIHKADDRAILSPDHLLYKQPLNIYRLRERMAGT